MLDFNYIWVLLLIIPCVGFLLYGYFSSPKKYRFNRNKITSLILGIIQVLSCVFLIANISYKYELKSESNELILVIDASYSSEQNSEKKDKFVFDIIEKSKDVTSLGIVKFGYDQVEVVELTSNLDNVYEQYLNSTITNTNASNIEEAINLAYSKFTNPKTSKIVLVTDGIQTDGNALAAISRVAMNGVVVDVAYYPNEASNNEIIPISLTCSNNKVLVDENIQFNLDVMSSYSGNVSINLYDNNELVTSILTEVKDGSQTISIPYKFANLGLHELKVEISITNKVEETNIIYSYMYLDVNDNILILEKSNESNVLYDLMKNKYNITVKNINDAPTTLNELREYDEVILMNIANSDMPFGFIEILNEYVSEFGGGLLTVGGSKIVNGQRVANTYNREDMNNTLYESMLPVSAEDYVPPIAVMLLLDVSGSMQSTINDVKNGAIACLDALDERDYVGVITFASNYNVIIEPTPMSRKSAIIDAIENISVNMVGQTVFTGAIEQAGRSLSALTSVNRKHTILLSDGAPGDTAYQYLTAIENNYNNHAITTSTVGYGSTEIPTLVSIAQSGNGKVHTVNSQALLTQVLKEELTQEEIREFEYAEFTPVFNGYSDIFAGLIQSELPSLDGFYGTKLKNDADALIIGEYGQPIYANWNYGKGSVGSFMIDFNEEFSQNFTNSEIGSEIISRIMSSILPDVSISDEGASLIISGNNINQKLSISTSYLDATNAVVTIDGPNDSTTYNIDLRNGYCELNFTLKNSGIYKIKVDIMNSNELKTSIYDYKEFSFSSEYNTFLNEEDLSIFLESLVSSGNGVLVDDIDDVFTSIEVSLVIKNDLRVYCAVILVVSILLDVIVKKFKIKWPWEFKNKKGV